MHYCLRHMEEPSSAQCRSCKGSFCSRCLVYAFGPRKPPYCVGCALHASGVRSGSRQAPVAYDPADGAADDSRTADEESTAPSTRGWRAGRANRKAGKVDAAVHHAVPLPVLGGLAVSPQYGEDPFETAVLSPLPAPEFHEADNASPSQLQLSGPAGSGFADEPYDL